MEFKTTSIKLKMAPDTTSGKIKIVRIITRLNMGGPALQAIILTKELGGDQFFSRLVAGKVSSGEMDLVSSAIEQGIEPIIISELGREITGLKEFFAFLKLVKILKDIRPHIVHTHTAKAGTLGRLAACWAKVPIKIHTFHGHVFEGYFGRLKTKCIVFIETLLTFLTDKVIVLSEGQYREMIYKYKIGHKDKFQVIPLGFDLSSFCRPHLNSEVMKHELGLKLNRFVVGFISRLVPVKNPYLLIQALFDLESFRKSLAESNHTLVTPWTLIIVGGGELHKSIQQEVELKGLTKYVIFLGWQQQMEKIYATMDVVVLTSLNEGTPVVLIEAMASGKTFIATDVGGVKDLMMGRGKEMSGENGGKFILYENGILIASRDSKGLVGALLFLLSQGEMCCSMGRLGQKFALERFGKKRLIEDIQNLYRTVLKEQNISE